MTDDTPEAAGKSRADDLSAFLREQRELVLSAWEHAVQDLPCASTLPQPELRDSLPGVLDEIAAFLERTAATKGPDTPPPLAGDHALARLREGFDNAEVVEELALLRDVVFRLWRPAEPATGQREQLRAFARGIDLCMVATARRFGDSFRLRQVELKASEKRFRDTFESAAIGLGHVSLEGEWLRMNDQYCLLLGYSRDELIGMRFADITHPDDAARDASSMSGLIAGDFEDHTSEKRCIRKDGSLIWIDQTLSLTRDNGSPSYVIAAAQDISRRVHQREQRRFLADASSLLASTLDYREALDDLAGLATQQVADWCMIDIADSAGELLQLEAIGHADAGEARRARDMRRRYPLRTDAPGPLGEALRTGRPALVHVDDDLLRSLAADESHFGALKGFGVTSAVVLPLRIGGRTMGTLSLAHSDSGRRFDEDDVQLLQELATMASAALDNALLHAETQQAVHLRDRVLGIVTHDLRNPLGTIDLSATLLAMNRAVSSDAAANAQIATIQRNVRRATRLIEDLLDMSTVQAGRFAVDRDDRRLEAILQEAADMQRPRADDKQIHFVVDIDVRDAIVYGDQDRLLQVLNNVIGNAVKFCKARDTVTLHAAVEDDWAYITVADTGPGIAVERLDQVFEPYVRVRQDEEGTGLGLFISKAIVDAHGGRIWAESEPGSGTTMHLRLPLSSSHS